MAKGRAKHIPQQTAERPLMVDSFGVGNFAADGLGAGGLAGERGRGALSNPTPRYDAFSRSFEDDGWGSLDDAPRVRTSVMVDRTKRIIARNDSPDIAFDQSINPYRGCEHGCVYCFARPTHAFLGFSPGLEFETKLLAKPDAARLLEKELAARGYVPKTIALGTNTDPYQPIERERRITREILEVLDRANHPVAIVTKSALVARDVDILSRMAERGLAKVAFSITTLDRKLARGLEPRAPTPERRLDAMAALSQAGVPTAVIVAPVIPGLTESEIETILERASAAGAKEAGYVLLRLPLEVRDIFREWLLTREPHRAGRVLALLKTMRDGKDYDSRWGVRQSGTGPHAWMIGRRFELAARRNRLNMERVELRTDLFSPPKGQPSQLQLF
jgi:DNA repair photolyase